MTIRIVWGLAALTTIACTRSVSAQVWRVDPKPILDISSTRPDGSPIFSMAVGASRLSSGVIVVADGIDAHLTLFDSGGREVSTIGRKGQGPGEFGLISWLGRCASDSVFVWDVATQRMTVINEAGAIVRQTRFPDASAGLTPKTLACSRDGMIAVLGWEKTGQPNQAGVARGAAPLAVLDRVGRSLARFGDVPAGETVVTVAGVAPRPLGKRTSIAVSANRLYLGTADSAAITSLDFNGRAQTVVRMSSSARRPTRRQKELAVEPLVAYFPKGSARDHMRQVLLEVAEPSELPPYVGLFTDPSGRVWVQTSHPGDETTRLVQLSMLGTSQGRILLPGGFTVLEVGEAYVLGTSVDANSEEHIVAYRMYRP